MGKREGKDTGKLIRLRESQGPGPRVPVHFTGLGTVPVDGVLLVTPDPVSVIPRPTSRTTSPTGTTQEGLVSYD